MTKTHKLQEQIIKNHSYETEKHIFIIYALHEY